MTTTDITTPPSSWSTQQLAEFLVAVAASPDPPSAMLCAMQWAAEVLEAEVAAVVTAEAVVNMIGFPRDQVPVADLLATGRESTHLLRLPRVGELRSISVPIEEIGGHLVLARSGREGFQAEETGLLRAMGRSLSMTLRTLRMLEEERSLRAEGELRAQENVRLVHLLQERQTVLEQLARIQVSISQRAPLPEVLDAVVEGAQALLGDEVVGLRLVDHDDPRYMNIVSSVGVSHTVLAATKRSLVSEGAGGRAIVENRLVVLDDYQNDDTAVEEFVVARLQSALAAPIHENGGHDLAVTASIGVVVDHAGETGADALLRNADLAMYRAKLEGFGKHMLYEPDMHAVVLDRAHLEGKLRRAVQLEEFQVHYQPIVWLASGEAVGVEALVRWRRDDGVWIPPAEFIPVAEDMGLIMAIGRMVMHTSMRDVREWQHMHPNAKALHLSINLSARQLHQPDVVAQVVEALDATGFDAPNLTLEITETALMHDTATTSARLHELRALGARIALDDFGTGYSSLSHLRTFPIDVLKVDKSFIDDIASGSEKANLARGIIELGRTLNLDIVAEGIEHPQQVAELVRLQCRMGQGYHFAGPLPADELSRYLHAQRGMQTAKPTVVAV